MLDIIHQDNNNVNSNVLKIAFLGTPDFAVPALDKLAQSDYKPAAVFCAPDKPIGRKQVLTPPPIKIVAQQYNIPVYQPATKQELTQQIAELKPNLILSAAYGIIVPKEVLDAPKYGCLNIHPSLLPRWRGASPIQATILAGDAATGVSIFKMDEGIDTGPIIKSSKFKVQSSKITTPELTKDLAGLGAQLLLDVLPDYLAGKIAPMPQDDSRATYAPQIKKEDGKIDWQKSATEIDRQIRAFTPWPGTYATLPNYSPSEVEGSKIKFIKASTSEKEGGQQPGKVYLIDDRLAVQTGSGSLIIEELQLEGSKALTATEFLRGHQEIIDQALT